MAERLPTTQNAGTEGLRVVLALDTCPASLRGHTPSHAEGGKSIVPADAESAGAEQAFQPAQKLQKHCA